MSLFIYLYRRPRRVWLEDVFKVVYLSLALISITLLIVTFADWVSALSEVFGNYWATTDATLLPTFEVVLNNCSYSAQAKIGGRNVQATVSYESRVYVLMSAAAAQNMVFGVVWTAIVMGVFNKVLYRFNWWHFRWRGLIVPTNVILPTLELLLYIWALVAIAESYGPCQFASDYVAHCTTQYEEQLRRQTGNVGSTVYTTQPFEIGLTPLLIVISLNLGAMVLAGTYLLADARRKHNRDWARCVDNESHWKPPDGWEPLDEEDGADTKNPDDPNSHVTPPKRFLRRAIRMYPKQIFRGCPVEVIHGRTADEEPTVLEEVLRQVHRLGLSQEVMRWMVGAPTCMPPWSAGPPRALAPPPSECPIRRVRVTRDEMQFGSAVLPAEEVALTIGPGGPDPEGLLRLGVLLGHSGMTQSGFQGRLIDREERAGMSMRLDRFATQERDAEGLLQLCSVLAGQGTRLPTRDGGTVDAQHVAFGDHSFAYAKQRRVSVDLVWVPDVPDGDGAEQGAEPHGGEAPVSGLSLGSPALAMSPAVYSAGAAARPGGDDGWWRPTPGELDAAPQSYAARGPTSRLEVTNDDI